VYNIAAGRTIPRWLDDKQKKSMRRDDDYRKRVEILQASPLLPPRLD
jgi:ribosome biogenesis protein ENP2